MSAHTLRLSELLEGLATVSPADDREIGGIALDSRRVRPGDLFLACAGRQGHGMRHLQGALHKGAVAVAFEPGADTSATPPGFPAIEVDALGACAGIIAARLHRHPSAAMKVVGVTGTNGKTSTSQFVAAALAEEGPVGVVGTLGSGLWGDLTPTGHTTPDPVELQSQLAAFRDSGARYAVMEVSSHGLDQGRVNGVRFDLAIFTNLTHEHLDYHGDMESYAVAKRRLFDTPGLRAAVINSDDPVGRTWLASLSQGVVPIGYGLTEEYGAQLLGRSIRASLEGLTIEVASPWGQGVLKSPLLGRFNASNLLAALGALIGLGLRFDEALDRLGRVQRVPGRMERFGGGAGQPVVAVDYAHTPDALEQALSALRPHTAGRVICLFGCGGDRDRSKRPVMGGIAQRLADYVVLTNDNPRHEDPDSILSEILRGISDHSRVAVIGDRAEAIERAISLAAPGDIVLVAGKGHETEQQIGDGKFPFSDREVVARLFGQELKP